MTDHPKEEVALTIAERLIILGLQARQRELQSDFNLLWAMIRQRAEINPAEWMINLESLTIVKKHEHGDN